MAYEGKSNTEIQNDLEDRIEFINEDISNNGKNSPAENRYSYIKRETT
jgi:tRNA1(Val) A37 N6-methylase TrmN6